MTPRIKLQRAATPLVLAGSMWFGGAWQAALATGPAVPPCSPDGNCIQKRDTWGVYQTRWRAFPGDLIARGPTPAEEGESPEADQQKRDKELRGPQLPTAEAEGDVGPKKPEGEAGAEGAAVPGGPGAPPPLDGPAPGAEGAPAPNGAEPAAPPQGKLQIPAPWDMSKTRAVNGNSALVARRTLPPAPTGRRQDKKTAAVASTDSDAPPTLPPYLKHLAAGGTPRPQPLPTVVDDLPSPPAAIAKLAQPASIQASAKSRSIAASSETLNRLPAPDEPAAFANMAQPTSVKANAPRRQPTGSEALTRLPVPEDPLAAAAPTRVQSVMQQPRTIKAQPASHVEKAGGQAPSGISLVNPASEIPSAIAEESPEQAFFIEATDSLTPLPPIEDASPMRLPPIED